jgi:two-component system phosphate regulon response regulator PhoB
VHQLPSVTITMSRTITSPTSSARRVLLVDDDEAVRTVVRLALEGAGYVVEGVASGEEAILRIEAAPPHLVVLDVRLPGLSGLEVLGTLRHNHTYVPVILLTANGEEPDRVLGLRIGADDYLAKPFSPRELVARVEAVLRRSHATDEPRLDFGDLMIDTKSHEVTVAGEPVNLTAKEFDLLRFLAQSPRQVFTRAQLLNHVWNSQPGWQTEATINEHVHRLRRKIERDPKHPRRLVTVHGAGYRFDP